MEFLKDYHFELSYHPDKVNVVGYALSRKCFHMPTLMVRECDLIEQFQDLSLVCEMTPISVKRGMLKFTSNFLDEIVIPQNMLYLLIQFSWLMVLLIRSCM